MGGEGAPKIEGKRYTDLKGSQKIRANMFYIVRL